MAIDRDHVRQEMDALVTEALLEILARHDEDEWSPEVFPLVEEVLRDRGVRVAETADGDARQSVEVFLAGRIV